MCLHIFQASMELTCNKKKKKILLLFGTKRDLNTVNNA